MKFLKFFALILVGLIMLTSCSSNKRVTIPHSNEVVWNDKKSDTTSLHYRPSTHVLGDVHPFWDNGTLYLYYLMPGGGYEAALVTSKDLIHYEPVDLWHTGPEAEKNYYVLGVMHRDIDEHYISYYGSNYNNMKGSVSRDLVHWKNLGDEYAVPAQPWFFSGLRDPYVFWNEDDQAYWCIMTGKLNGRPEGMNGAIALSTSPDLKEWQDEKPLYVPNLKLGEHEVPMMFKIGKSWYLLYSVLNSFEGIVGKPSYLVSKDPRGPWEQKFTDSLDGGDLRAAQVCFQDESIYLMGWIPNEPGNAWGGSLNLPRLVYQLEDGSLGTKFDPQVISRITGPQLFPIPENETLTFKDNGWNIEDQTLSFQGQGRGIVGISGEYSRFTMKVTLIPHENMGTAGINLSLQDEDFDIGLDLDNNLLAIRTSEGEELTSIHLPINQSTSYSLHLIVEDDIIEVNCNDTHTLAAKLPARIQQGNLALFAHTEAIEYKDVKIFWLNGLKDVE